MSPLGSGAAAPAVLASVSPQPHPQTALVTDQLHGDTIATANANTGALSSSTLFEPWGTHTTSGTVPLGYQGGYTDPDTGLTNAHARWYNPTLGVFTSRDTWTLEPRSVARANRYLYGNGSPLTRSDVDGHEAGSWCVDWACAVANGQRQTSHPMDSVLIDGVVQERAASNISPVVYAAAVAQLAKTPCPVIEGSVLAEGFSVGGACAQGLLGIGQGSNSAFEVAYREYVEARQEQGLGYIPGARPLDVCRALYGPCGNQVLPGSTVSIDEQQYGAAASGPPSQGAIDEACPTVNWVLTFGKCDDPSVTTWKEFTPEIIDIAAEAGIDPRLLLAGFMAETGVCNQTIKYGICQIIYMEQAMSRLPGQGPDASIGLTNFNRDRYQALQETYPDIFGDYGWIDLAFDSKLAIRAMAFEFKSLDGVLDAALAVGGPASGYSSEQLIYFGYNAKPDDLTAVAEGRSGMRPESQSKAVFFQANYDIANSYICQSGRWRCV